jgi:hypothetical protein
MGAEAIATTGFVIYVGLFFLNALFVQLCFNHLRERLGLQAGDMGYWDAMVAQIFVTFLSGYLYASFANALSKQLMAVYGEMLTDQRDKSSRRLS